MVQGQELVPRQPEVVCSRPARVPRRVQVSEAVVVLQPQVVELPQGRRLPV